jgi:hypothetical protein
MRCRDKRAGSGRETFSSVTSSTVLMAGLLDMKDSTSGGLPGGRDGRLPVLHLPQQLGER